MKPSGPDPKRSFLSRLVRDARGNTLAIVGAALVPLTGMIGSGIDMSRAYMAKTRLQSACDAATLAGRRVMTNDTVDTAVRDEAGRFFFFNFPVGVYGSNPITMATGSPPGSGAAEDTFYVWRSTSGTVAGRASTALPTGVMHLFGFETMDIQVDCEASQNFVNTDILLVLDTTGSMLQDVNGANTSVVADQKITALRAAVLALYDELRPVQTQLESAGMRLRYGVVPYSSGVNVGHLLRAEQANYVVTDRHDYYSRRAIYLVDAPRVQTGIQEGTCDDRDNWTWNKTSGSGATALGTCNYTVKEESYQGTREQFKEWDYGQTRVNVSNYVTGTSTPVPSREPGTTHDATWAGCIEERQTVDTITSTSDYSIPAGARDLDIDLIPTNRATRWKPYWPEVSYRPDSGDKTVIDSQGRRPQVACPTPARTLTAWARADLSTYLDSLNPTGGTYHDNGMIWGARLISDAGVFADSPFTFNGMPVAKHIIFMTDGVIDTGNTLYSTYGMEYWDERVTGGWTSVADQTGRHEQRFRMLCNSVKTLGRNRGGTGVSIWVVGFGTTVSPVLEECASNAQQVSTNANRAELIATFTEIGKNIGALRLTQ